MGRRSLVAASLLLITLQWACVRAGFIPQAANIVLRLDASGLAGTSRLSQWNDSSGNGFNATQSIVSLQPAVIPNNRFCLSTLRTAGTYMTIPNNVLLNPQLQGFSWAILSREATNNEANSIAKADTFYADWRVGQGGAGGGLSTVEAYSGAGYCGAMTYAQTDLQHFQAWVGTLASATSGSVPRTITGYYDGNSLNWQARWSYCYNTLYGSVSSTQSVSIGTAGYSGDIMEIIVWKGVALNQTDVNNLQNYFATKYFYYCPPIVISGASLLGTCTGASIRDYSTCTATCTAPYIRVSGTASLSCMAGSWSAAPAVCEPSCFTLNLPTNADQCTKQLFNGTFGTGTSNFSLASWLIEPVVPASVASNYWSLVTSTVVSTTAGSQCSNTAYNYSVLTMAQPAWLNTFTAGQSVSLSLTLNISAGAMGIVFRYSDPGNHYFFMLDANAEAIVYGLEFNSVQTRYGSVPWTNATQFVNTPVDLVVRSVGSAHAVTILQTNVTYSWNDSALGLGSFGLLSHGTGNFINLIANTTCDGGGAVCQGLTTGQSCTFGCAVGYTAISGTPVRSCNFGTWTGGNLICSIDPPVFLNTSVSIYENATANGAAGAPMNATHSGANVAITYQIIGGNGSSLFKIGLCDGQIRLLTSGTLDFLVANVYELDIQAVPDGAVASAAVATITVDVLYVNKPPKFNDTGIRSVYENATAGLAFGASIEVTDPQNTTITLSVVNGSSGAALFGIDASFRFYLLSGTLDYRSVQAFQLTVQAADAFNLTSTMLFTIAVLYVNKPPVMSNITYTVLQSNVAPGYIFAPTLAAQDPQSLVIEYFLADATYAANFSINSTTGEMSIIGVLLNDVVVPIMFNDSLGLVGHSFVSVQIVAPGVPALLGIGLPSGGLVNTDGSSVITLHGNNFVTGTYTANYTNGLLSGSSSCVYVDANTLSCTTSPGYGASFAWRLFLPTTGVEVLRPSGVGELLMTYSPPVGLTISKNTGIPTNPLAPSSLTISGSQLYNSCAVVQVVVGGWVWAPITCTFTSILVQSTGGGGGNLTANVTVGSNWALVAGTVSYLQPAITTLVASLLPTSGNGPVTISGVGFGPAAAALAVTYAGGSDGRTYTATCIRQSSTLTMDVLQCAADVGVGTGHVWTVCVVNQCSPASTNTTSYIAPVITSITGAGAVNANTAGGQLVTVTGSGFGPPSFNAVTNMTYGHTGVEYIAKPCTVLSDTPAVSQMSCITAPGTGANLVWALTIVNQLSSLWNGTSYAPPSISYFTGPGAVNADTAGGQLVNITGNNFGAGLTPADNVSYTLVVNNPVNATLPIVPISPATNGSVVYYPQNCAVLIPHTLIQCLTVTGGGKNLQWTIVIDGQANRVPITNYAVPTVSSLAYSGTGIVPTGVNGIRTDGNVSVILTGADFGPASAPLVQWVRITSPVAQYPVTSFTVLSDTQLNVTVSPGVGANLSFAVSVAGQESPVSLATFDYLPPSILSLSPATGPTFALTGYTVLVTGHNFGLSAGATVAVQVGNAEDNTRSAWIPAQPWYPPGDDGSPRVRANESVQFVLPPGVGTNRTVRVAVYPGLNADLAIISSPAADGAPSFFSYQPPVVATIVSSILDNTTQDTSIAQALLGPGVPLTLVRKILLTGTNFGSQALLQATGVGFVLDTQPYIPAGPPAPSLWNTTALAVYSWVDTSILAYTVEQTGFVRVRLTLKEFATGVSFNVSSNVGQYEDVSPHILSIISGNGAVTQGGSLLALNVAYLETTTVLSITVANNPCPVVNPADDSIIPAAQVGAWLFQTYGHGQPSYNLTCMVPPGQGSQVPIVVTRDSSPSSPFFMSYGAPVVASVTALDPFGAVPLVTQGPSQLQLTPTEGGVFIFNGVNFGQTPLINMTYGSLYWHAISFDPASPYYVVGTTGNSTQLTFPVPLGEGVGWIMWLVVGDQTFTSPIPVAYKPPVIVSITSNSSTAGDGVASLTGLNFGTPVLPNAVPPSIVLTRARDGKSFYCTLLPASACIVSRSNTALQFVVPPGAGSSLSVTLMVASQSVTTNGGFSYAPPVITSMIAVGAGPSGSNITITGVNLGGPMLIAPAIGLYHLVLQGVNFGPGNDDPSMYVRWQGTALAPVHDTQETFVGEGEVWVDDVVSVDHTQVVFVMPPGLGTHDIIMMACDQVPLVYGLFQYAAPVVTSMDVSLFPTDTSVSVTLKGTNFGPPTVAPLVFHPIALPLGDNNRPATAQLVIGFGVSCGVVPCVGTGCLPLLLKPCDDTAFTFVSDGSLQFNSFTGIGVNLTANLSVVENIASPQGTRILPGVNTYNFSYMAPSVASLNPSIQLMDQRISGYELQLTGNNVGLQKDLLYITDFTVVIVIDGVQCDNPLRAVQQRPVYGPVTVLSCEYNVSVVGPKSMQLYAARQWGPIVPSSDPSAFAVACARGFYGLPGNYCLPCPVGASCDGYVNGNHTLPVAGPGWYNLGAEIINPVTNESLFDLCPDARGIVGRADRTCVVPCQPAAACAGANLCGTGYRDGPPNYRCSLCASGFYMSAGSCVKCPSQPLLLIILFIAASILLCIGGWILSRKNVNIAFLSIGVDYFQVLAIFYNTSVKWPSFVTDVFHIFSLFNFNIDITAPECAIKSLGYELKWWISMQLPVAAVAIFLLIWISNLLYKRIVMREKAKAKLLSHTNALIGMFFVMFYFLYLYLTRTIFDIFNCSPLVPPDGKQYLQVAFVECGTGFQKRLTPPAIVYLIFYALGYPIFVGFLVIRNRLTIMEDQLLVAKGTGENRLTNPHCYDFRKKFSKLYYQFKPDQYYWILCVISRKFTIAIASLLFRKNTSFQLAVVLLVMFIAYALQVRYRPYLSPSERNDVLREHVYKSLRGGLHARLAERVKAAEAHGKKAARNTKMTASKESGPGVMFANAILAYFFNYNTVEMTLLFCCVLIALGGIMFESDRFQDASFQSQKDFITAILIIVIIGSVIYFVSVVVAEMWVVRKQTKDRLARKAEDKATKKAERRPTIAPTAGGRKTSGDVMALSGREPVVAIQELEPDGRTLKSETNPMFATINVRGEAVSRGAVAVLADTPLARHEHRSAIAGREDAMLTQDAIAAMIDPPPQEAWETIRTVFVSLVRQVDALSAEVSTLKRRADLASLSGDESRSVRSVLNSLRSGATVPRVVRPIRRTFEAQMAPEVDVTANPLRPLPPGVPEHKESV